MTSKQPYPNAGLGRDIGPGLRMSAVTPSDSTEVNARGLYVGTSGDLAITGVDGATVTFKNVPSGTVLPIFVYKVRAATTAADIVAQDAIS